MTRRFPLALLLLLLVATGFGQPHDGLMPFTIMEYNCENLFDCRHDSLKEDTEFLPDGERRWGKSRYWRKLNDIGRVIHQCGDNNGRRHLPDLVALVEVENDSVMHTLTRRSMLREAGYRYVMTQSPDRRGIDVALLYNPLTFALIAQDRLRVTPPKGEQPTRDILYVKGRTRTDDTLHVFVVHAPSRSGGWKATERYRMTLAQRIISTLDSIRTQRNNANIIITGDFNDYSYNKPLMLLCDRGTTDLSAKTAGKRAKGTYKHHGRWNSLDHILLSATLVPRVTGCRIHDPLWLLESDTRGGYKPRRTYLGTYYHGGVSDHLPLVLELGL